MPTKSIFITGASSGFGLESARVLLAHGHNVIVSFRGGEARFRSLYTSEIQKYGSRLDYFELHMEKTASFSLARNFLEQKFQNGLDVLINNAGFGLMGPLEDMTESQMRYQMDVNFMGPVLLTNELLPLIKKARGRIINISSMCGRVSLPYYGMYSASKYALEAYTEALHYDLKGTGVQLCLVEPGGFQTDFTTRGLILSEKSQNPASPYYKDMQRFSEWRLKWAPKLAKADPVIAKIVKLCEKNRIPLRAPVGIDAYISIWIHKFLPTCLTLPVKEFIFQQLIRRFS